MSMLPAEPPSPCQGICRLEADTCVGCGRLIGEVAEWPRASAARKTVIRADAARRLAAIEAAPAMPLEPYRRDLSP